MLSIHLPAETKEKTLEKDRAVVSASGEYGEAWLCATCRTFALSSRVLPRQSSDRSWHVSRLRRLLLVLTFWERTYPGPGMNLVPTVAFTATTELSFGAEGPAVDFWLCQLGR